MLSEYDNAGARYWKQERVAFCYYIRQSLLSRKYIFVSSFISHSSRSYILYPHHMIRWSFSGARNIANTCAILLSSSLLLALPLRLGIASGSDCLMKKMGWNPRCCLRICPGTLGKQEDHFREISHAGQALYLSPAQVKSGSSINVQRGCWTSS